MPGGGGEGATGPYLIDLKAGTVEIAYGNGQTRTLSTSSPNWPADLKLTNVEGVGFTLLADHPGGIEVAGVILLMAMLGAVVLARKKVELDEQAKLVAQTHALIDEASVRALREVTKVDGPEQSRETKPGRGVKAAFGAAGGGNGANGRTPHIHGGAHSPSGQGSIR